MKIEKQKLHLSLWRKVLFIFRYDRNGKCIDDCNLRDPRAVLPDVLDKLIKNRIQGRLRSILGSRSTDRNSIFLGLRDAAKHCGCEPRLHRGGRVLTFYLNRRPLISFDVRGDVDDTYKHSREYANSQAIFKLQIDLYRGIPCFSNTKGS
jgi:hypothetical protein